MIKIDGVVYSNVGVNIKRTAAVTDGKLAGRSLSGEMIRDIIGTYYNYSATFMSKSMGNTAYDQMYQVLTAPVDSHEIEVPYGQGTLVYDAYVTNATDELLLTRNGQNYWGNLTLNFIAMEPQRRPSND